MDSEDWGVLPQWMAALASRQRVPLSRDMHAGALEDLGFRFGREQRHASCSWMTQRGIGAEVHL